MEFNVKHIEEHHEKLLVSVTKSILISDNNILSDLESNRRHNEWLFSPKYSYMREQMKTWVDFLKTYSNDLKKTGKSVMDVIFYENEGRKKGKKEDMILVMSDGFTHNISLKTLKKGKTIQTNSSTFYSFILGFIFDKKTMQKYFYGKNEFTSRSIKKIKHILKDKGYNEDFIKSIEELYNLSKELRNFVNKNQNFLEMEYNGNKNYVSERGEIIDDAWKAVCEYYRNHYKPIMLNLINQIQKKEGVNMIRRGLVSQGIFGDYDTIVITQEKVYNLSHKNINVDEVTLNIDLCSEGLRFNFNSKNNFNITSTIPLTINRNGAWNLDLNRDNDYFKIDNTKVPYGHMRPKKSRQIATSTNTYIKIDSFL